MEEQRRTHGGRRKELVSTLGAGTTAGMCVYGNVCMENVCL